MSNDPFRVRSLLWYPTRLLVSPGLSSRVVIWLAGLFLVWVCRGLRKHTPMSLPHLGPVFLIQRPRPYLYLDRVSHPFQCFLSALFFSSSSESWFRFSRLSFPFLCAKSLVTRSVKPGWLWCASPAAYTSVLSYRIDEFGGRTTPISSAVKRASLCQHGVRMYRGQRVVSGGIYNARLLPEQASQHLLRRRFWPGLDNPTGHWDLEEDIRIHGLHSGRVCTRSGWYVAPDIHGDVVASIMACHLHTMSQSCTPTGGGRRFYATCFAFLGQDS